MTPLHQEFTVRFRYSVHSTQGVFARDNTALRTVLAGCDPKPNIAFVIDRGVVAAHPHLLPAITRYCESLTLARAPAMLVLDGGESIKNDLRAVLRVHALVRQQQLCRHSLIVAIGGGALLDAVGFAAATAHRGIRLVRLPTTVLAQCDAGIGVKNGVNRFGAKNFMGTFAPPFAVINDAQFLTTLADRDWRAGLAEAVKIALLKDADFFTFIERNAVAVADRNLVLAERVIARCAQLHLAHIAGGDPFESGSSRPLDFGHWVAHWLEQESGNRLRHGEAVAIGIALDCTYAHLRGWLDEASWQRILQLLHTLGFALRAPELSRATDAAFARALGDFREHLGGELAVTLIRAIGSGFDVHTLDPAVIRHSIHQLEQFQAKEEATWQSPRARAL